ncbi:Fimbrial assembly protein (PilN) [Posidoniimonas polymericola]|uniref:Fimbrial assembly protein (PilN) n=1 Tax=Posidoniimonas polymericola TaxID=2528002 RepID=A0A5C5YMJ1_9BACT|nr:PilN domain-containing protein [Posidoniimonas polymericola]TWT76144.1 Fimbrial assembly protein (PilN) [Posidoniimonas polymericola]
MSTPSINLLPDAIVVRHEHRRQLRKWAPVWAGAFALLVGAQLFLQWRVEDAKVAVAELHDRVRPLYRITEQIESLKSSSAVLAASVSQRVLLEQADVPLATLHVVALTCQRNEIELDLFRFEDAGRVAARDPGETPAPSRDLILKGAAVSDVAVSQFIRDLKKSGLFTEVALESSQSSSGYAAERTFQIRCQWTPSAARPAVEGATS